MAGGDPVLASAPWRKRKRKKRKRLPRKRQREKISRSSLLVPESRRKKIAIAQQEQSKAVSLLSQRSAQLSRARGSNQQAHHSSDTAVSSANAQ
jgi:hypothetical protein